MESNKNVKKSRQKYDASFKQEVLRMIESGRPVSDVCTQMGLGANLVYSWMQQGRKAAGSSAAVVKTQLQFDAEKLALEK